MRMRWVWLGTRVATRFGGWRGQSGQGMTEYGLIIALIAVVVITVLTTLGQKLESTFTTIINAL